MGMDDAVDRLYRDKVILAPMVRAGTLPLRALALRYGADTVFTEEVIDRRVVHAVRTENPLLGTVDFVESRGKKGNATPFQTCPALERGRLVYQIGTGDATHALRAAQHVERDVAAVDVNMGCPKRFSLQGAMGAALLRRPEVAADIVGTLRRNLSVPVSVKIRLLDTPSATVEFAKRMEKAGACALTVHVRRVEDKPASKARWEELRPVVDAVNIPVIANGDVYTRADMRDIKVLSGCSSVMLARPALLNCSIFKPDGNVLPLKEVIQQYLRECFRYDSIYQNAKYTVMEMLTKRRHPDHLKESISLGLPVGAPGMREVTPAKNLEQLAKVWDVEGDFRAELARRTRRAEQLGENLATEPPAERGCVHKFDDAYFLEPEAAKIAPVEVASSDTPKPSSSRRDVDGEEIGGSRTVVGGNGGGVDADPAAAVAPAAAAKMPRLNDDTNASLKSEMVQEAASTCADGSGGGDHGTQEGSHGRDESAVCTDGTGARREQGAVRPMVGEGDERACAGEHPGAEAQQANGDSDAIDVARESGRGGCGSGDGVVEQPQLQQQQPQDCCGVGCAERGNGHGGGDTISGDEGLRPPWTSSKRPRKEEARQGTVL
ncbi:unnamed protein product [Hapterophycus canaliculatus]